MLYVAKPLADALQEGALLTTKLPAKITQIPRKGLEHGGTLKAEVAM